MSTRPYFHLLLLISLLFPLIYASNTLTFSISGQFDDPLNPQWLSTTPVTLSFSYSAAVPAGPNTFVEFQSQNGAPEGLFVQDPFDNLSFLLHPDGGNYYSILTTPYTALCYDEDSVLVAAMYYTRRIVALRAVKFIAENRPFVCKARFPLVDQNNASLYSQPVIWSTTSLKSDIIITPTMYPIVPLVAQDVIVNPFYSKPKSGDANNLNFGSISFRLQNLPPNVIVPLRLGYRTDTTDFDNIDESLYSFFPGIQDELNYFSQRYQVHLNSPVLLNCGHDVRLHIPLKPYKSLTETNLKGSNPTTSTLDTQGVQEEESDFFYQNWDPFGDDFEQKMEKMTQKFSQNENLSKLGQKMGRYNPTTQSHSFSTTSSSIDPTTESSLLEMYLITGPDPNESSSIRCSIPINKTFLLRDLFISKKYQKPTPPKQLNFDENLHVLISLQGLDSKVVALNDELDFDNFRMVGVGEVVWTETIGNEQFLAQNGHQDENNHFFVSNGYQNGQNSHQNDQFYAQNDDENIQIITQNNETIHENLSNYQNAFRTTQNGPKKASKGQKLNQRISGSMMDSSSYSLSLVHIEGMPSEKAKNDLSFICSRYRTGTYYDPDDESGWIPMKLWHIENTIIFSSFVVENHIFEIDLCAFQQMHEDSDQVLPITIFYNIGNLHDGSFSTQPFFLYKKNTAIFTNITPNSLHFSFNLALSPSSNIPPHHPASISYNEVGFVVSLHGQEIRSGDFFSSERNFCSVAHYNADGTPHQESFTKLPTRLISCALSREEPCSHHDWGSSLENIHHDELVFLLQGFFQSTDYITISCTIKVTDDSILKDLIVPDLISTKIVNRFGQEDIIGSFSVQKLPTPAFFPSQKHISYTENGMVMIRLQSFKPFSATDTNIELAVYSNQVLDDITNILKSEELMMWVESEGEDGKKINVLKKVPQKDNIFRNIGPESYLIDSSRTTVFNIPDQSPGPWSTPFQKIVDKVQTIESMNFNNNVEKFENNDKNDDENDFPYFKNNDKKSHSFSSTQSIKSTSFQHQPARAYMTSHSHATTLLYIEKESLIMPDGVEFDLDFLSRLVIPFKASKDAYRFDIQFTTSPVRKCFAVVQLSQQFMDPNWATLAPKSTETVTKYSSACLSPLGRLCSHNAQCQQLDWLYYPFDESTHVKCYYSQCLINPATHTTNSYIIDNNNKLSVSESRRGVPIIDSMQLSEREISITGVPVNNVGRNAMLYGKIDCGYMNCNLVWNVPSFAVEIKLPCPLVNPPNNNTGYLNVTINVYDENFHDILKKPWNKRVWKGGSEEAALNNPNNALFLTSDDEIFELSTPIPPSESVHIVIRYTEMGFSPDCPVGSRIQTYFALGYHSVVGYSPLVFPMVPAQRFVSTINKAIGQFLLGPLGDDDDEQDGELHPFKNKIIFSLYFGDLIGAVTKNTKLRVYPAGLSHTAALHFFQYPIQCSIYGNSLGISERCYDRDDEVPCPVDQFTHSRFFEWSLSEELLGDQEFEKGTAYLECSAKLPKDDYISLAETFRVGQNYGFGVQLWESDCMESTDEAPLRCSRVFVASAPNNDLNVIDLYDFIDDGDDNVGPFGILGRHQGTAQKMKKNEKNEKNEQNDEKSEKQLNFDDQIFLKEQRLHQRQQLYQLYLSLTQNPSPQLHPTSSNPPSPHLSLQQDTAKVLNPLYIPEPMGEKDKWYLRFVPTAVNSPIDKKITNVYRHSYLVHYNYIDPLLLPGDTVGPTQGFATVTGLQLYLTGRYVNADDFRSIGDFSSRGGVFCLSKDKDEPKDIYGDDNYHYFLLQSFDLMIRNKTQTQQEATQFQLMLPVNGKEIHFENTVQKETICDELKLIINHEFLSIGAFPSYSLPSIASTLIMKQDLIHRGSAGFAVVGENVDEQLLSSSSSQQSTSQQSTSQQSSSQPSSQSSQNSFTPLQSDPPEDQYIYHTYAQLAHTQQRGKNHRYQLYDQIDAYFNRTTKATQTNPISLYSPSIIKPMSTFGGSNAQATSSIENSAGLGPSEVWFSPQVNLRNLNLTNPTKPNSSFQFILYDKSWNFKIHEIASDGEEKRRKTSAERHTRVLTKEQLKAGYLSSSILNQQLARKAPSLSFEDLLAQPQSSVNNGPIMTDCYLWNQGSDLYYLMEGKMITPQRFIVRPLLNPLQSFESINNNNSLESIQSINNSLEPTFTTLPSISSSYSKINPNHLTNDGGKGDEHEDDDNNDDDDDEDGKKHQHYNFLPRNSDINIVCVGLHITPHYALVTSPDNTKANHNNNQLSSLKTENINNIQQSSLNTLDDTNNLSTTITPREIWSNGTLNPLLTHYPPLLTINFDNIHSFDTVPLWKAILIDPSQQKSGISTPILIMLIILGSIVGLFLLLTLVLFILWYFDILEAIAPQTAEKITRTYYGVDSSLYVNQDGHELVVGTEGSINGNSNNNNNNNNDHEGDLINNDNSSSSSVYHNTLSNEHKFNTSPFNDISHQSINNQQYNTAVVNNKRSQKKKLQSSTSSLSNTLLTSSPSILSDLLFSSTDPVESHRDRANSSSEMASLGEEDEGCDNENGETVVDITARSTASNKKSKKDKKDKNINN